MWSKLVEYIKHFAPIAWHHEYLVRTQQPFSWSVLCLQVGKGKVTTNVRGAAEIILRGGVHLTI